jgi:hypothetical protein
MSNTPYTGFRFEWSRPDINSPNGVLKVHCIAVATSLVQAQGIMADSVSGSLVGVRLIDRGEAVLAEAKQRGVADGQGVIL